MFGLKSTTSSGTYYCRNCLNEYRSENKLKIHAKVCVNNKSCQITMPTDENKMLTFKNNGKHMKAPFVLYADLECLLKETNHTKAILGTEKSYTQKNT